MDGGEKRLRDASVCDVLLDNGSMLHYPGASVGVALVTGNSSVDEALQLADNALFTGKAHRRLQGFKVS